MRPDYTLTEAFLQGRKMTRGNAATDGTEYKLHGHTIAKKDGKGGILFDWCGRYTTTTAAHMNKILTRINAPRVSYTRARDSGQKTFLRVI